MPVEVQSPPTAPHHHQKTTMGATETENTSVVDAMVRAIQSLTTDANYKLVSDIFSEVMFLKDQNTNLKIAKRELLEEYRSFRNELEDEEKKLKDEKEALEKKVEEKDGQISELNDTKTQLTEAKASLELQVEEKSKELATLTEAKTGLESEKSLLEAKIAEKETELAELNDAKSKLTEEKASLESTVEEKTTELAAIREEKATLEASLAEKTKEAEGLAEEKAKLTDEKAALEATVAEKDTELQGLRAEKTTLTEEKEALEANVSTKEKEITELQEVKSRLESDLATLTEVKLKLETDLTEANSKIEEQAKQAEANAEEISSLKASVEQHVAELTGVKDELSGVKEQLSTMTTTAEEAKARGDALESDLKEMTAKADEKAARVETLEGEVAGLTSRVEEASARISTLEGGLEEMTEKADERAARIETLDGELSSMTTTANEAKARVEFLETELGVVTGKAEQLQTDLVTTTQDLEAKNARLAKLDSYRVSLRSDPEDTYVQILDTIWTSIAGLVETQFRQDLDHSVLTDESCWANLRQSEYLKHARQIPLPQSNSPAAKQMRVAAVLAVLSRALHRYIFRPVYLTENGSGDDGIVNMLRAIACDNATREEHTRATLLAMLPEKQKAAAAKRVSTVVREVSWSVQHLLSALQYEAFCNGLETACKLACLQWMRIQAAQMKIEPYFGPPFDDYDWQVLPLPAFEVSDDGVHFHGDCDDQYGAAVVDDTDDVVVEVGRPVDDVPLSPRSRGRVIDQEDQKSFRSSPRPMTDYDGDSEVGPDEIMLVVWPSMCALENGELESITQGLVISKDQVRAASDEVRGRGRQRPTTKRARTLSMPGRGVSGSAGKVFLSQGDGDESKDG